jgi:hypothetical protein
LVHLEEGSVNFLPYDIAARSYGWANRDEDVLDLGAESVVHFANGFSGDPSCGTPPTGMNGPDDGTPWVEQEEGDTVRSENAKIEVFFVR